MSGQTRLVDVQGHAVDASGLENNVFLYDITDACWYTHVLAPMRLVPYRTTDRCAVQTGALGAIRRIGAIFTAGDDPLHDSSAGFHTIHLSGYAAKKPNRSGAKPL